MKNIPYDIKKDIIKYYLNYNKCKICQKDFCKIKYEICCKRCYFLNLIYCNLEFLKDKLYFVSIFTSLGITFFFNPFYTYIYLLCFGVYFYFMHLFIKSQ